MEESMLWAVALWSGAFGLLLLVVGGLAAVYLNARARRPEDPAPISRTQSHAGDIAAADKTPPPVQPSEARRTTTNPLAWAMAWVYAFLHAGIVSVVLGGITFFEDLSKASEEIQQTGRVTFPRQLLPGTLSGAVSPRLLGNPQQREGSGDDGEGRGEAHEQPGSTPPDGASEWEVVS
jgi:hypothetical protein